MADLIIIASAFIGVILFGSVASLFAPNHKSFSVEELGIMAFSLVGLIVGIIIGDLIVQNLF